MRSLTKASWVDPPTQETLEFHALVGYNFSQCDGVRCEVLLFFFFLLCICLKIGKLMDECPHVALLHSLCSSYYISAAIRALLLFSCLRQFICLQSLHP